MRPPVDTILAPAFAKRARWIRPAAHSASHASAASTQALLVAFWDVCQPSSLRTLPYLTAWHERYGARGLRIVAAHAPSSDAGCDEDQVTAAVSALEIGFEVMLDTDFALWQDYENPGWPARYVLASGMRLVDVHFGEGGYTEAERADRKSVV